MGFLQRVFGAKPPTRPHDDPDLESQLPAIVAGRPLDRWSLRGESAFTMGRGRLSSGERSAITEDLAELGVGLDNVSMATAGRSVLTDPPYLITAWRFGERDARALQLDLALDRKGVPGWRKISIGSQQLHRGTVEMVEQTSHLRGRPHVLCSGAIQFTFVTDDDAWAKVVCGLLPSASA